MYDHALTCLFIVVSLQHNGCTCLSTLLVYACFLFTTGKPLNISNASKAVIDCPHWHQLGILLNVDHNTLEEISEKGGLSARRTAVLDAWLNGNANPSWRQLADALKAMGDLRSSQAVEKYC